MDISGLLNSNYYSDFLKTTSNTSAAQVKSAASSVNEETTDEELMGVCKQFEAYLLEQVFKEMEKTITFGDEDDQDSSSIASALGTGSGSNTLVDYFKQDTLTRITENATNQGEGLGLAQMLYDSMKRQ